MTKAEFERLSHKNFVSVARDLIEITDTILKTVIEDTEKAAMDIGEQIQKISSLTSQQSQGIKELIHNMHTEGQEEESEIKELVSQTNKMVDDIFEQAKQGNIEEAYKIGTSEEYQNLKEKTSSLVKKLEKISHSDENISEVLMPVITALQFQDRLRQNLENIIKVFNIFFHTMSCFSHEKLPAEHAKEFWSKIEDNFTSNKERNIVRKVVYGEESVQEDYVESGDSLFF